MPGQYTIRVYSSVPPAQHAHRKVLIEAREEMEKALQKMVDNGIIAPATEPNKWVSSLTYPRKSDGSIHSCLDPCDLSIIKLQPWRKFPTNEVAPQCFQNLMLRMVFGVYIWTHFHHTLLHLTLT